MLVSDQSWRSRPMVIALETVSQADERIAEHARDHRVLEVGVILHGGEPLLTGVLLRLEETRYDIGWPLHDCAHLGLQPDELGGLQPERIPCARSTSLAGARLVPAQAGRGRVISLPMWVMNSRSAQ